MINKFLESVERAERSGKARASIATDELTAAKDFIKPILEARSKGGKRRHAKSQLSQDPAAIRNREAVRRHRAKTKGKDPPG